MVEVIRHFLASDNLSQKMDFKAYRLRQGQFQTGVHDHDYLQIWYVRSGRCRHGLRDHEVLLTPGDVFVVPPGVIHAVDSIDGRASEIFGIEFLLSLIQPMLPPGCVDDEPFAGIDPPDDHMSSTLRQALFDFAYLEPLLSQTHAVQPRLHLRGDTAEAVERLFLDLIEEFTAERPYYQVCIQADILKLLTLLARTFHADRTPDEGALYDRYRRQISEALDYIGGHFTERLNVTQVARIAGLSRSNFSSLFKRMTGRTFVEHLNKLRVRQARELLRDTSLDIAQIGYQSGFNDPAYFNRVFKRETGRVPGGWRE